MSDNNVSLSTSPCKMAFMSFMDKLNTNARESFWYCAFEQHTDNPDNLSHQELKELTEKIGNNGIEHRKKLLSQSLQRQSGLNSEEYNLLGVECGLLRSEHRNGEQKYIFLVDEWKKFVFNFDGAEVAKFKVKGSAGQRYFIRLGPKQNGYHNTANKQVSKDNLIPPRVADIDSIRRGLKYETRKIIEHNPFEADGTDSGTDDGSSADEEEENSEAGRQTANDKQAGKVSAKERTIQNVKLRLEKLGIDCDLSKDTNYDAVKSIIGDLITLQQYYTDSKTSAENDTYAPKTATTRIEYYKPSQESTSYAICVGSHKSEKAFKNYHRNKPYIQEFMDAMESRDDKEETGPRRIAEYLAWKHRETFIHVANDKGLAVCGVMDEVESAAMYRDAGLLDTQARIVLKHLRFKFKAKVACPFQHIFMLIDGYTEPKTIVKEFKEDGKLPELVVAHYQSIDKEFIRCVLQLLEEYNVPRREIEQIRLVLAGDHGQGAFRLCFRVVINVASRDKPIHKTTSIAEVYCKKEKGVILEETIMEWLEEDLKKIESSELRIAMGRDEEEGTLILDDRGKVVSDTRPKKVTCEYVAKGTDCSNKDQKIIDVSQLLAGDFAWQMYCLGRENMSGDWCMYCMLSPLEWSVPGHGLGELWTIQSLTDMANSNKKGTARLGVKVTPKLPWILVRHRILPKLHVVIGLINDCIVYFETKMDWELLHWTGAENVLRIRIIELRRIVPEKEKVVSEWQASRKGMDRRNLMAKIRKFPAIGPWTQAMVGDQAKFQLLDDELKVIQKDRDKFVSEKKTKTDKFEALIKARRVDDKKGWYIPMESNYRKHGIDREDYHKRKFSGRPLNQLMDNARSIFDAAKEFLPKYTSPDVNRQEVGELCDAMSVLLKKWKVVFDLLDIGNPTELDKKNLKEAIPIAINEHRKTVKQLTPKAHTMEDHGHWQYCIHTSLPLIMEEFGERNHQDGRKLDEKVKRIPDPVQRGITAGKRKAFMTHGGISKHIELVHADTARGPYKKKSKTSTESDTAAQVTPARRHNQSSALPLNNTTDINDTTNISTEQQHHTPTDNEVEGSTAVTPFRSLEPMNIANDLNSPPKDN